MEKRSAAECTVDSEHGGSTTCSAYTKLIMANNLLSNKTGLFFKNELIDAFLWFHQAPQWKWWRSSSVRWGERLKRPLL